MKTTLFTILLTFFITIGYSQTQPPVTKPAEFVGGNERLEKYLKEENLIYPERAKKDSIEGYFKVAIAIDDRGRAIFSDFVVTMSDCSECEQEALRLINKMPKWNPRIINGKAAYSSAVLTIVFELQAGNVKVREEVKTAKLDVREE